jgi:ubiquinone/menaquinone biosynthesis C-methylase UbiE
VDDRVFNDSIPATYDRCLTPLMFRPYAEDLARRLAGMLPGSVLEIAAGTGVVTEALSRTLTASTILATDLNTGMLDAARHRVRAANVHWAVADARALPVGDARFDTVACQFGVMFVSDRPAAYAEVRRVLRPGGRVVFTVWDRIETNPIPCAVAEAVAARYPDDPPRFLPRTPHGYADPDGIRAALDEAGFTDVTIETVTLTSRAPSAWAAAVGFCQGTPMRHEIQDRDPAGVTATTRVVAAELVARFGDGEIAAPMQALVVTAG